MRRWTGILAAALALVAAFVAAPRMTWAQRTDVADGIHGARDTRSAEAALAAKISVQLDNPSLASALDSIALVSGTKILYRSVVLEKYTKPVRLTLRNVALAAVLDRVLAGTDLRVVPGEEGRLLIVTATESPAQVAGVVTGVVTNSATRRPVGGVRVALDGTTLKGVTDDRGMFRIAGVPAGTYTMTTRGLGYSVASQKVIVAENQTVTVAVALVSAPTTLTEVVTTGAGDRRRVEVGSSIATINADSVVRTTPIRNLSDLLSARVPGVDVLSTSGEVGAPSTIRIRGAGSITSTTDPIVIVDGIRVNGGHKTGFQDRNGSMFVANAATTSPLNDIDPSSIESIDVLRGPSASAIYGSDAANGVIVVKTKRGVTGPTRWNFFGESGTSYLKAKYPENYFGWGSSVSSDISSYCALSMSPLLGPSIASGTCEQDSVTHFSPINHEDTSPFGNGYAGQLGGDVSGGTDRLQYFLGGSFDNDVGMLRLSDNDVALLARMQPGQALKDWQKRPNIQYGTHVDARLTAHVSDAADVGVSTSYLHQYHRVGMDTRGLIYRAESQPGYRDTVAYGWTYPGATPAATFSNLHSDITDRLMGNVNGTWRPLSWVTGHGAGGVDHSVQGMNFLQPRGALDGSATGAAGQLGVGTATTRLYSGDIRAETAVPLTSSIVWRSSVGSQLTRTQYDQIGINAQGLAFGSTSSQGATLTFPTELHQASATMGWYVETRLAFAERFFATASLRSDRGSAFSNGGNGARFPKFNASWLVSQEPLFQRIAHGLPISNLRLRAAYGQAGVQPDIAVRYRTYQALTGAIDGIPTLVGELGLSLGNSALLPERSVETETGLDLGLWNDRVTAEATFYRKVTKNALVASALPPSYGNFQQTTNLGRVNNDGVELSLTAQPIVSALATWNVTFTYAKNSNKLVKGGDDSFFGLQRYVVGYPLNAYWDRPIVGYADLNGNGTIELSEIQLGDSAVYLGAPYPKADMSVHQTLSLWSGKLALGVGLDIRDHFTQYNQTVTLCSMYCRGVNDPSASAYEQVRAQEAMAGVWGLLLGVPGTQAPFLETVSWVRLNELSLTYTLPVRVARTLKSRNASLSLMGRNLGLWTKYRGADPEVNSAPYGGEITDFGGIAQPRQWSLRLNLGF